MALTGSNDREKFERAAGHYDPGQRGAQDPQQGRNGVSVAAGATTAHLGDQQAGVPRRYGMSLPFAGIALGQQRDRVVELADLGYTDVWSSEADGSDAFTPLVLASQWAPSLRLGCAIVPAFTRGPALLAQTIGALAQTAPGRFAFGLGASSNVIVQRWNGIAFEEPYKRTRDMLAFLRVALTGEKVTHTYDTMTVDGFRLGMVPPEPVPLLVAGLREGMLRLAGREADGAIINWLSAEDVAQVVKPVIDAGGGAPKEIVARIFVAPSTDDEAVYHGARFAIAAYLNVPVYAAFHQWLGRGELLAPMWEAWQAGDRKAALAAIPDSLVDELIVHGPPEKCREQIQRYLDNGVTTAALSIMAFGGLDVQQAVRDLAPR